MGKPHALSEIREVEFVLEDNQDDDDKVTFTLKSLRGKHRDVVRDRTRENAKVIGDQVHAVIADYMAANRLAVQFGLVGWDGLERGDGSAVKFPGKGMAAVHELDDDTLQELGEEIRRISELTGDEAKN